MPGLMILYYFCSFQKVDFEEAQLSSHDLQCLIDSTQFHREYFLKCFDKNVDVITVLLSGERKVVEEKSHFIKTSVNWTEDVLHLPKPAYRYP